MNNQQQSLSDIALPTSIAPNFFRPESTPQRVLVNRIEAFGEDGKGHVLQTKDPAGKVIEEKQCVCYAVVDVLDAETLRTSQWEVLSKPAAVQLRAAVTAHGKTGATTLAGLMVDVWSTGRGKEKQFHVARVSDEQLAKEAADELAKAAAASAKTTIVPPAPVA